MQELQFGQFGASIILSILLRMVFNVVDIPNKIKPWIAIALGMILGIIGLYYEGAQTTFANYVNYLVMGFMMGATAVGIYEVTQKKVTGV